MAYAGNHKTTAADVVWQWREIKPEWGHKDWTTGCLPCLTGVSEAFPGDHKATGRFLACLFKIFIKI